VTIIYENGFITHPLPPLKRGGYHFKTASKGFRILVLINVKKVFSHFTFPLDEVLRDKDQKQDDDE
jgi:hypothetical protein